MRPSNAFKHWLDTGLGFIYPEVCQICGDEHATVNEGYVCAPCWQRVRFIKPPFCERCGLPFEGEITAPFQCGNCRDMEFCFQSARSAVLTGEVILDVIHRYKYQQALWFEPFLADLLARQAAPELARGHWDLIVPVPLHAAKRRERGFNQAGRLADQLGRATGIPVRPTLLRRVKPAESQTRLSRAQRAVNVRGAFVASSRRKLEGRPRVVLVDDVFTTGATTSACAGALREIGAAEVCVWTVTRGL
jgi:competence protein ComFC